VRLIVTRPQREADRWVSELAARGVPAFAMPLIEIGPAPDQAALQQAAAQPAAWDALMFVSANGVEAFFKQKVPVAPASWAQPAIKTRAWAPGPGTRDALLQAGVAATLIDAPADDAPQFDSEALWQQVAPRVVPGWRVLFVRGADASGQAAGRDWLAARLAEAGAQVDTVVAYVRRAPAFSDAQAVQARRWVEEGTPWLFSSSEAVAHLVRWLPDAGWPRARAIATHPRIAQAAREAGFGVVCLSRPAMGDIVAALESIR
jgi:uroporphyrinogen-III synthase